MFLGSWKFQFRKEHIAIFAVAMVYVLITIFSWDHCYFWDNTQHTSKGAHWFFEGNFSSFFMPTFSENAEIVGTGDFSLLGFMTAILWSVFGKHLWVSHLFILFWGFLLMYHTLKLVRYLLPNKIMPYAFLVVLLEPALLAQLSIASPDIILLAAFVGAIRGVLERRPFLLSISAIFLTLISGRGFLTAGGVLLVSIVHGIVNEKEKISIGNLFRRALPFVPGFVFYLSVFMYYHSQQGMAFSNGDSPWKETWDSPDDLFGVLKNIAAYGLRLLENGRFFLWSSLFGCVILLFKQRKLGLLVKGRSLLLGLLLGFLFLVFFYFAVTTKMIISTRYYLGLFFVLSILTFRLSVHVLSYKKIKIGSILAVFLLLTGHFWVYPDKIAQSWDASLVHWPYYQLRKDCLDYIKRSDAISFEQVSGGFCFAGHQRYVDLENLDLYISGDNDNRFFIFSNLSNLEDGFLEELNDPQKWREVETFKKGSIVVSIRENLSFETEN